MKLIRYFYSLADRPGCDIQVSHRTRCHDSGTVLLKVLALLGLLVQSAVCKTSNLLYIQCRHLSGLQRQLPWPWSCEHEIHTSAALHEEIRVAVPSMGDSVSEGTIIEFQKQPGA